MIIRLILLIGLPIAAYFFVQNSAKRFNLSGRNTRYLYFFVVALLVIGILIVLGRLPVQFILAPLGVAATYLLRLLPMLLRLLPMLQMFKGKAASAAPKSTNDTSKISTRFLAVELDHDSGAMDGEVLEGQFSGTRLSQMSLSQLAKLAEEVGADMDSEQVFVAYMSRAYPDWQPEHGGASADPAMDESEMSAELAYEVLGISTGASAEEITKAHRKLMQKMHPDRGGSDYLAKKINLAKDVLLARQ
ncbi:MAG: DnaJ domain-containing protein [Pseudohongiellaceae bacterium]